MKEYNNINFLACPNVSSQRKTEMIEKLNIVRDSLQYEPIFKSLYELNQWSVTENMNIVHSSGKFFSVEAVKYKKGLISIDQPILNQPEVGMLGIITQVKNNVPMFLMQYKMEPGNYLKIQISPTVQATKSNYSGVHQGKMVNYIEYFLEKNDKVKVLYCADLSEQNSRFLDKKNTNMVISVDKDVIVEEKEGFDWFTIKELIELLQVDNCINMNARSILSMLKFEEYRLYEKSFITEEFDKDELVCSITKILNMNALDASREIVPIEKMNDWAITNGTLSQKKAEYNSFTVKGLQINTSGREVSSWEQPILENNDITLNALACKISNGKLCFLVRPIDEVGSINGSLIGPTVQSVWGVDNELMEFILSSKKIIHDSIQSDEGGRFFNVRHRHLIVELEHDIQVPKDYLWLDISQIKELITNNLINIELRSLITCIPFK